jgi:predicted O-methyltransferase YrrM
MLVWDDAHLREPMEQGGLSEPLGEFAHASRGAGHDMPNLLKVWLRETFPRIHQASRVLRGHPVVFLGYPVVAEPRFGYRIPPHSEITTLFASQREDYRKILCRFRTYSDDLRKIPLVDSTSEASWINRMMPPLDSLALYSLLRLHRPKLYIEVGSGYSTKMARRAVQDGALQTTIVSIDPHPHAEIDSICNEVIRKSMETVEVSIFDRLQAGDVLFVDGSHCCYMNSDVTVFFLEVLPRLRSGVIVQIHDIALPYDYPPEMAERYYSEQYLLACCLTHGNRYKVLLPNHFVARDPELSALVGDLWQDDLAELKTEGMSLWLTVQ